MLLQISIIILATFIFWKLLSSLKSFIDYRNVIRKLPSPPGAHWLQGHLHLNPYAPGLQWLRDTVITFPRVYTLWKGMKPMPILVHPDTIKPLVSDSIPSVKVEDFRKIIADWLGEGLVFLNGAKWKRHRRLLTRSFHLDVLKTYIPVDNDCVEILLGKMDKLAVEAKPMRITRELLLCTFDVILRTAFSYESNIQLDEPSGKSGELNMFSANDAMVYFIQQRWIVKPILAHPWIFRFSSMYSDYTKAYVYIHKVTKKLIEERQKEHAEKTEGGNPITKPRDFLDTLLMAKDADGSGLTRREIMDEVTTFLFAGHETTSTTMTWLLYALAKHPEHQQKIRQEVEEILDGRASDRIGIKDISRMEYMTLVIKESMRMNNSLVTMERTVTAPFNIEGVTVPAGTSVGINLYQLHHNPAVWGDDHMEFKPSRFLPENFSKMDPFAYLPFSAGLRNCIGQQFAMNKIKVFVARILSRFRLSLVEGEAEPVPEMKLFLRPQHELLLGVESIN